MATSTVSDHDFRTLLINITKKLGELGREELCFIYDVHADDKPSPAQVAKALLQEGHVQDCEESLNKFKNKLEALKRKDMVVLIENYIKSCCTCQKQPLQQHSGQVPVMTPVDKTHNQVNTTVSCPGSIHRRDSETQCIEERGPPARYIRLVILI